MNTHGNVRLLHNQVSGKLFRTFLTGSRIVSRVAAVVAIVAAIGVINAIVVYDK